MLKLQVIACTRVDTLFKTFSVLKELQKNLFKKRSVLLKATEKSLDETMQSSLRKRAEKDASRAAILLDEKIQIQQSLLQIIQQHQQRLEKEVYRPLNLPTPELYPDGGPFADIPEPQISVKSNLYSFPNSSNSSSSSSVTVKISPRKRTSLADEPPTDPNEPTFCICNQVSWGEMVACDGANCKREWFHYPCVGLTEPPKGPWHCPECSSAK